MKTRVIIFLIFLALVSGCARVVTLKDSVGDVLTLSVNFEENILSSGEYYLVLSTDGNFQVPEDVHKFEEPCFVLWNDLPDDEKDYLVERYSTWAGYIVVDALNIYRVKGTFSTTEEAAASYSNRYLLDSASSGKNITFEFLLSDIFGGALILGQNIYFDVITTDGSYLKDRLGTSGNYIRNIRGEIVQNTDDGDPSIDPGLDIRGWAVSIQ